MLHECLKGVRVCTISMPRVHVYDKLMIACSS